MMLKYFKNSEDYPNFAGGDILPLGTLYCYVSTTFLEGFVNYAKPIKAFVLGRYRTWDETVNKEIRIQHPPNSRNWVNVLCERKSDLFNKLTVPGAVYHVKLDSAFQDDVLILSKAKDKDYVNLYYFFWFDRDCSDSCIGRFATADNEETVIAEFCDSIKTMDVNPHGEREIPLHYFRGWLSS